MVWYGTMMAVWVTFNADQRLFTPKTVNDFSCFVKEHKNNIFLFFSHHHLNYFKIKIISHT